MRASILANALLRLSAKKPEAKDSKRLEKKPILSSRRVVAAFAPVAARLLAGCGPASAGACLDVAADMGLGLPLEWGPKRRSPKKSRIWESPADQVLVRVGGESAYYHLRSLWRTGGRIG
jgi:hypothetical protein